MKKENLKEEIKMAYIISLIVQIGIVVSCTTVSSVILGNYLDEKFKMFPTFIIIGAILSFPLAMFFVYRLVLLSLDKEKKDK